MTASPVRKMRLELIRAAFAVACCPEAHRLVKSQSRGLENIELPARDSIQWTEPTGWRHTFDGGVDHDYCYGCSDARKAKPALD